MIGVIANSTQHAAVREFFELFKTPWEFYRSDRDYRVLVCAAGATVENSSAELIVVYDSHELPLDIAESVRVISRRSGPCNMLLAQGTRIPLYKDSVTFASDRSCILVDEEARQNAAYAVKHANGTTLVRIGYDLFDEITALLTDLQPSTNAGIPTLDCHISLLRSVIVGGGVPLVEIPPVPEGYRFIACLTHDVDHPSIRLHKFDHTMFGFLYRATIGSLLAFLRGRASFQALLINWAAVLKLPFVHLGLAKDFWNQLDTYDTLEMGARSSFFVIPFKGRPGVGKGSPAPSKRASGYGAADIAAEVQQLLAGGHEIGLHGIDAWHDGSKAREEVEELRRITGVQEIGVRMHWLYFDKSSPAVLEGVGVDYDSSIGYNETIGYRAGTTQVYKPLGLTTLLELPLHIMDTALFSPGRLNLSPFEASKLVNAILDNAVQLGGVVTVNWHDRSIASERLWRDFYVNLISELHRRGAWLTSATETVQWFRKRRLATFDNLKVGGELVNANASIHADEKLPGLCVHVHNSPTSAIFTPDAKVAFHDPSHLDPENDWATQGSKK